MVAVLARTQGVGRPSGLLGSAKFVLSNFGYFLKTDAPLGVHLHYVRTLLKYAGIRNRYRAAQADFAEWVKHGRFSTDWVSAKIPFWLEAFGEQSSRELEVLEIGSWEGMSSCFLLRALPKARLTCVDTWMGGDEHQGRQGLNEIEANFEANIAPFRDRVTKIRNSSLGFFATTPAEARYDLIYVDGSHRADDVIVDAVQCHTRLKVGGLMILDDYLWRDYDDWRNNPAPAINAFLKMKAGCYEHVLVYHQLILRKVAA